MMKSFPGDITSSEFLERYWQKEHLVVGGALPDIGDVISFSSLAALACRQEVESRVVTHDADAGTWKCEYGPFEESRFENLSGQSWTLLVQSVDLWIPLISRVLEKFEFLPRWRLDDVMISYATDGASVGLHFDYYDVFLLQASGERRWQLGQRCDARTPLADHPDLKLLRDFRSEEELFLGPGDMLYVPSELAHWGQASGGDCVTLSIGFRAPSHRDVVRGAVEEITAGFAEDDLYRDRPGAFDQDRWCINRQVTDSLNSAWEKLAQGPVADALPRAFGEQLTEPRNPDLIFPPDDFRKESAAERLSNPDPVMVVHNPASRFAYRKLDEDSPDSGAELYADGQAHFTTFALARGICNGQLDQHALARPGERELVLELLSQGSLYLPWNPG